MPAKPSARIGIFGGTFNPIHFGHLNSIETVLTNLDLDKVWVVPANQNPNRETSDAPDAQKRLEMLHLGLGSLPHLTEKIEIKTQEIDRAGISYTIDTLEEFQKLEPLGHFYLVIGADQFESFDKWKDYKKILLRTTLVVTSRPGLVLPIDKESCPAWLTKDIRSFEENKLKLKSNSEIIFVSLRDVEASSTEIRRRLRRRENVSHLVPSTVADYAIANRLYDGDTSIRNFSEFTKFCMGILNDKGALTVNGYDLRPLVQPSEFSVAASGTSTRHTRALCEHVIREAKDRFGIKPQSTEGLQEGRWIIVDYGSLMIHVFYDFVRNEYKIEELWAKAGRI